MGNCPLPLQVGFKVFSGQLLRHLTHTRFGSGLDQQTGRELHLTSPVALPNPAAWESRHHPGVQCWPLPDCISLGAWQRLNHFQAQTNTQLLSSSLKNINPLFLQMYYKYVGPEVFENNLDYVKMKILFYHESFEAPSFCQVTSCIKHLGDPE